MVPSKACDSKLLNDSMMIHITVYAGSTEEVRFRHKVQVFDGQFIDPFNLTDLSAHLTNFATDIITPIQVQNSMLDALDKEGEMATAFMKERFIKL